VEGTVELSAVIGKDGHVDDLKVIHGSPLLIALALDAVKQWVYQPTYLNGKPVTVETEIDVTFRLATG
jgi:periplasmic protein TonB